MKSIEDVFVAIHGDHDAIKNKKFIKWTKEQWEKYREQHFGSRKHEHPIYKHPVDPDIVVDDIYSVLIFTSEYMHDFWMKFSDLKNTDMDNCLIYRDPGTYYAIYNKKSSSFVERILDDIKWEVFDDKNINPKTITVALTSSENITQDARNILNGEVDECYSTEVLSELCRLATEREIDIQFISGNKIIADRERMKVALKEGIDFRPSE